MNCGKALKVLMAERDVSGRDMAREMGLSHNAISGLRARANWKTDMIAKVSVVLGISEMAFIQVAGKYD